MKRRETSSFTLILAGSPEWHGASSITGDFLSMPNHNQYKKKTFLLQRMKMNPASSDSSTPYGSERRRRVVQKSMRNLSHFRLTNRPQSRRHHNSPRLLPHPRVLLLPQLQNRRPCRQRRSLLQPPLPKKDNRQTEQTAASERDDESRLLSNVRQVTFVGQRAGEGYFSQDGSLFVFQSEREPGNPFFQIYLMDLHKGHIRRVSPGVGKATCPWIHPSKKKVLFASTHLDPQAREKQQAEFDTRASGENAPLFLGF